MNKNKPLALPGKGTALIPAISIDIANCELEPIRFPGAVQPHGALLVLQPASGIIEAASESCDALLGLPATSLLGQPLQEIFGSAAVSALLNSSPGFLQPLVRIWLFDRGVYCPIGQQ